MRLDKWLWQARFYRSRALATRAVETTPLRIDGRPTDKPHATVAPGMVLTFAHGGDIKVIRVLALGERRGPATEARTLYSDVGGATPPTPDARDQDNSAPADALRRRGPEAR